MMLNKNETTNQNGQILVFVIVVMTIALALGLGISMRTLKTLSDVSQTNTSQLSLASAEGTVERVLGLTQTQLASLNTNMAANCAPLLNGTYTNNECLITFEDTTGDGLTSKASIALSTYNSTGSNNEVEFDLQQNDVHEIFLTGYAGNYVDICWTPTSTPHGTVIQYKLYGNNGNFDEGMALCRGTPCSVGDMDIAGAANSSTCPGYGQTSRLRVQTNQSGITEVGLRVKALGGSASVTVVPQSGQTFVPQGYRVVATGYLENSPEVKRVVEVFRSFQFLPEVFDFSFYAQDGVEL